MARKIEKGMKDKYGSVRAALLARCLRTRDVMGVIIPVSRRLFGADGISSGGGLRGLGDTSSACPNWNRRLLHASIEVRTVSEYSDYLVKLGERFDLGGV